MMEDIQYQKNDMKNLTYDQLLLFLKNIDPKKNGGRLDLLKTFLKDRDIPFKDGLWDWRNQRRKLTLKICTSFGHTPKPEARYH